MDFQGEKLLDRKGDGSYEEYSTIQRGLPANGPQPVPPPRKHVVEYMQVRIFCILPFVMIRAIFRFSDVRKQG